MVHTREKVITFPDKVSVLDVVIPRSELNRLLDKISRLETTIVMREETLVHASQCVAALKARLDAK